MHRAEIEDTLNQERARLLNWVAAMPQDALTRPLTPSEDDPASSWSAQDHVAHLAGIERAFAAMIRRHLAGDANPVGVPSAPDGTPLPRAAIPLIVHARNEAWVREQRDRPLSAVIALGQASRASTLAPLAELTDDQLAAPLPGAPWADGTIGGVLAVNAEHARRHRQTVDDGFARLRDHRGRATRQGREQHAPKQPRCQRLLLPQAASRLARPRGYVACAARRCAGHFRHPT